MVNQESLDKWMLKGLDTLTKWMHENGIDPCYHQEIRVRIELLTIVLENQRPAGRQENLDRTMMIGLVQIADLIAKRNVQQDVHGFSETGLSQIREAIGRLKEVVK